MNGSAMFPPGMFGGMPYPPVFGPPPGAPRLGAPQPISQDAFQGRFMGGIPFQLPQSSGPPAGAPMRQDTAPMAPMPKPNPLANAPMLGDAPATPPGNPLAGAPMLQEPQQQGTSVRSASGGFGDRLSGFLGSDAAMALGIGLLSGEDWGDGLARGFSGVSDLRATERERQEKQRGPNATAEYLRRSGREDLVELAEAGMGGEALRIMAEDRKAATAGRGAPDLEELFDEATGLPYKAAWNPATGEFERVGGVKAASGMSITTNPDGTVSATQGAGMKPLTEGQSKDAGFAVRAAGALPIIDQYDEALTNLPQSFAGSAPVVGNFFKSENFQKAEQAGIEFLLTILRKDSGAAVPDNEREEYGRVFLPRPGDSQGVIAQKRAARYRAIQGLLAGMPPQAILNAERGLGTNMPAPPAPNAANGAPVDPLGIR